MTNKYHLSTDSKTNTGPSLLRSTRGSAGKEYLLATFLVGLMGMGAMTHFGSASQQAIAGNAGPSSMMAAMPPTGGMALSSQAGKNQGPPTTKVDPSDPLGYLGASKEELQATADELNQQASQVISQLDGVDVSQLDEQTAAAYQQTLSAIDAHLNEVQGEINHRNFTNQYASQGDASAEAILEKLYTDYETSSTKLAEWEKVNGPCFNESTGEANAKCGTDIQFLANVNAAQGQDVARRMYELGYFQTTDDKGNPTIGQNTDENGNLIPGIWQGSWSLAYPQLSPIMGEDGSYLTDKDGNTYLFLMGTDPVDAVNGKVPPVGYFDAKDGKAKPLDIQVTKEDDMGKEGGPLSFLKNTGLGILKEGWDMVYGAGVGVWRVGYEFLGKDVIGGVGGAVCHWFGGCKESSANPLHNAWESITNFGKKTWPALKAAGNNLWHNGILCLNLGNHQIADHRGQSCGRTILSVAALLAPWTKGGSAGAAAAKAGEVGAAAEAAGTAGRLGKIAAAVTERVPGAASVVEKLSAAKGAFAESSVGTNLAKLRTIATENKAVELFQKVKAGRAARAESKAAKAEEAAAAASKVDEAASAASTTETAAGAATQEAYEAAFNRGMAASNADEAAKAFEEAARIKTAMAQGGTPVDEAAAAGASAADDVAEAAAKAPASTRLGRKIQELKERYAAHKTRKAAIHEQLGHKPTMMRAIMNSFSVESRGTGLFAKGTRVAETVVKAPFNVFKLPKNLFKYLMERPAYTVKSIQLQGFPWARFGRFISNNRDVLGPAGTAGGAYNHGEKLTEQLDAQLGYTGGQ